MKEIFFMHTGDFICSEPNRERPRKKSRYVNKESVCIKFDDLPDLRYPMSYVMWSDSLDGGSGFGWVLTSKLRPVA